MATWLWLVVFVSRMCEAETSGFKLSRSAKKQQDQYEEEFNHDIGELYSELVTLTKALKRKQEIDDVRAKIVFLIEKKRNFEETRQAYYDANHRDSQSKTLHTAAAKKLAKERFRKAREEYNKALGLGVKSIFTVHGAFMLAGTGFILVALYFFQSESFSKKVYGLAIIASLCFCIALGVVTLRPADWFRQFHE